MTTITAARATIYQEYFDNAAAITVATDLTFENEEYDKPVATPWVRLSMRHFGGGQESLGDVGSRKFNREGSVFVQVFIPQDQGLSAADIIAQEAREIFEGKTLSGIRLFTAEIREVGLTDGYHLILVEIGFEYTETR